MPQHFVTRCLPLTNPSSSMFSFHSFASSAQAHCQFYALRLIYFSLNNDSTSQAHYMIRKRPIYVNYIRGKPVSLGVENRWFIDLWRESWHLHIATWCENGSFTFASLFDWINSTVAEMCASEILATKETIYGWKKVQKWQYQNVHIGLMYSFLISSELTVGRESWPDRKSVV